MTSRNFFGITRDITYTPADCICDIKQLLSPPGCTCGGGRRAIEATATVYVKKPDPFERTEADPLLTALQELPRSIKETYEQTATKLVNAGLRVWLIVQSLNDLKVDDYVRPRNSRDQVYKLTGRRPDGCLEFYNKSGHLDVLTNLVWWEVLR